MKTIFKYKIDNNFLKIEIFKNAKILTVQEQRGEIFIWAEVNTLLDIETREFILIGTGHEIPDYSEINYIGTVQLHNGDLVIHVYEKLFN